MVSSFGSLSTTHQNICSKKKVYQLNTEHLRAKLAEEKTWENSEGLKFHGMPWANTTTRFLKQYEASTQELNFTSARCRNRAIKKPTVPPSLQTDYSTYTQVLAFSANTFEMIKMIKKGFAFTHIPFRQLNFIGTKS